MKMKIGGARIAEDLCRIEAALSVAELGENLAVDANAALDLGRALEYAGAMAAYGLAWFEEPIDPLDYEGHAELAAAAMMPLATAENVFSMPDARNLIRHGGLRRGRDWLQFDPSLCYGPSTFIDIVKMTQQMGGRPGATSRTAASSWDCIWLLDCSLAVPKPIPWCSSRLVVLAMKM